MRNQAGLPVRQAGQVVLILILVMTVALAIGISVVQRSLSDISTSTKVEESSRAFSAAEAGIEKALSMGGSTSVDFTAENQSKATVSGGTLLPIVPTDNTRQEALEFPPLSREQTAHVWLADFNSMSNPPTAYYTQDKLDVYWGNSNKDLAALELTLIYWDGSVYKTKKWYLDHSAASRGSSSSNFEKTATCPAPNDYQCYKQLSGLPPGLMMLTARLLHNSTSQPFAVQAVGTCAVGGGCFIPPQARIFYSTGIAGQTQRRIKLFQIEKVAPPYFDYGIFSVREINK